MDALGQQMAARKQDLLTQIKSGGLPPPETRTFEASEIQQGEPVETSEVQSDQGESRPGVR